jgi:hypothetical protein
VCEDTYLPTDNDSRKNNAYSREGLYFYCQISNYTLILGHLTDSLFITMTTAFLLKDLSK